MMTVVTTVKLDLQAEEEWDRFLSRRQSKVTPGVAERRHHLTVSR
jgi:hypothetical protein